MWLYDDSDSLSNAEQFPIIEVIHSEGKLNSDVSTFLAEGQIESLPNGLSDNFANLNKVSIHFSLRNVSSESLNGLKELKEVNFIENFLKQLPEKLFNDNSKLTRIDLSDNLLTSLPADLLKGLHWLKTIDLDNNKLTSLPEDFFSDNRRLENIYLRNNQLAVIPANSFDGLNLNYLGLSSNVCVDLNAWNDELDEMSVMLAHIKENCVAPEIVN